MTSTTKGAEQDKSIIFLHIPKTAGTTLDAIMLRQYEQKSIFPLQLPVQESIAKFKSLPEDQKREIKVLYGHMRFGLHEYFPQPSTYITIMRDPVERIISLYYYILRTPKHDLYHEITSKNMSLKDCLCSKITTELDNAQARLLYGVNETEIGFGQCSNDMLETVKKNLEEDFALVGLTERFDESLLLLKRIFGWESCFYVKQNITKNRPLKEEFSKDTLALIEKYNELDIEIYKYGEKMLNELIDRSSLSEMEIIKFKLLNGIYSRAYPFYRRVVKKLNH